ncbi:MAG: glycosyltransferase, partial [Nitrospirae bacterium]|nr:glycosyltransferase [Nitrospirota bacterium]
MTVINYIIDNNNVDRLTSSRKWLDTYVPSITQCLEKQGFNVVFDKKSDFDLIHIHIPMALAYRLSLNNKNGNKKPIIFHGNMTEDTFQVGTKVKYIIRKWFKSLARKSDIILAPSLSAAEYFNELLPDKDVRQLNYGIDLNRYAYSKADGMAFREQQGLSEDVIVVSCVGGLTKRKGVQEFFEMAHRFPDIRFMWVGGMFYKGQSIQTFYGKISHGDQINLKDAPNNVLFTGNISDVQKALSASDIFFFPSHQETQGLALVEAAANSRPIITRDLPVFREWLTNGVDCFMGTDLDEFESYIQTLSQDVGYSSKLGKQALESARKHHDINNTSKLL